MKGYNMNVIKMACKEETNKDKKLDDSKSVRYYLKLEKTDIFHFAVDVPKNDDVNKQNLSAISFAWDIINKNLLNKDEILIGSGFSQEILKKEEVNNKDFHKNTCKTDEKKDQKLKK
jgi:hypothetical protein